jgi:PhnB protein
MPVNPIPESYHSVTPSIAAKDANAAIDFYTSNFGATEVMRMPGPGGKVMHAEIQIGDSRIMLADEFPKMGAQAPEHFGGSPQHLMIYTEDADAVFKKAIAAGSTEVRPLVDQFYGDRSGTLKDPFGHQWTIATHVEDVSEEELGKRMAAMGGSPCGEGAS